MALSHYTLHCKLNQPLIYNLMKTIRRYSQHETKEFGEICTNPYYEKYAHKIAAVQQTSPENFQTYIKEIEEKRSSRIVTEESNEVKSISKHPQKAQQKPNPVHTKQKTLDNVMKTELLKEKSPEEISKIWQDYHQMKKGIAAVIPATIFGKIYSYSKEFPTFLYPVPRKEGYEFILGQFSDFECHFTPLINFQAYKENAPTCLNIIHYPELQQDKVSCNGLNNTREACNKFPAFMESSHASCRIFGIVLMHGEFDDKLLTVQEAQCLANQVQLYYGGNCTRKLSLLRTFNKTPQSFRHMELIKEFELLGIS